VKSVLVVSFSDLGRDPRVHRQLVALRNRFELTSLGYGTPCVEGVTHLEVAPQRGLALRLRNAALSLLRLDDLYYWLQPQVRAALVRLRGRQFDVVLANNLDALPLCIRIAQGRARVIVDAHEYAPREFEDRWTWRLLHQRRVHALCRDYLPRADGLMTVCQGIADAYERDYGVKARVVTNATAYQRLSPSPVLDGRIRLIHHGVASPSRHPEEMIRMMHHLDERFSLDLMLIAQSPAYLHRLVEMAHDDPRIRFLPPVEMPAISAFINSYDVGLFLLPPVNFNYAHALPNKFFEFVQARLAIAIGPSPEMQRLVETWDLGVVAEDFTAAGMARALSSLTRDRIEHFKRRADAAAAELCAERNETLLLDLVEGR
jgi:glycosyltransferase involved in cell wall biosynthesis